MPSVSGMRKGFGLEPGSQIGKFKIDSSEIDHIERRKYQHYEYPCTITFKSSEKDKVGTAWKNHIGHRSRIIHSEYGSPYECWFEEPVKVVGGKRVVIKTTAVANRRRDLPTLKQIVAAQRPPESKSEIAALERDQYRVVKSHWATSKCVVCRDRILPGQLIGKRTKGDARGGWGHVHCLAGEKEQKRSGKGKRGTKRERDTGKPKRATKAKEAPRVKRRGLNRIAPDAKPGEQERDRKQDVAV